MFFHKPKPIDDQINVFMRWCFRIGHQTGTWRHWLEEFVKTSDLEDVYDVEQEHITQYLSDVSVLYRGDHQLSQAEKAVRSFVRYYIARNRLLSTTQFARLEQMSITDPKPERNRELVLRRYKDPKKWSWGALSIHYGMTREACRDIYSRHLPKYVKSVVK